MGTLFMVDAHTPVLLDSEINDTIPVEFGTTQVLNGSFGVNVPFGVPIDGTPANLTDLLTQKFAGLLAYYPGYTYIDYDEGVDATGWDAANSGGAVIGSRGTTYIRNNGYLQSNSMALTGAAPSVAILVWEVFRVTGFNFELDGSDDNAKDGVLIHRYEELDPSEVSVMASFDGGTSWVNPITDGVQFSIPAWQQGTNLILAFSNSSGKKRWIGSWAVIY